jgi:hypothetical protein
MKSVTIILCVLTASVGNGLAQIGNQNLEIHCTARKLAEKTNPGAGEGGKAVTKQDWAYDIVIENKSFHDIPSLEVKYIIFFSQQHLGKKEAPQAKRKTGSISLPSLRSHEKKTVTTESAQLTKASLVGDYYFIDGAKIKVEDSLTGLWIRIYQNGQQFAEYANPSTLLKEKWE